MSRLNNPQFLKGYWKLNSTVLDYSGYNNNGTWTGVPAYTTRWDSRTCALFDGSTQYISCGNDVSLQITGELTISVWVQFLAVDSEVFIISKDDNVSNRNFYLYKSSTNYINFGIFISGVVKNVVSDNTMVANRWYHVVGINDGTSLSMWIDGNMQSTTDTGGIIDNDVVNLYLGATSSGTLPMNGAIAEVRIYNCALIGTEILNLFQKVYLTYKPVSYPIDSVPDVSDSTLRGAWLNKNVICSTKDNSTNNNDGTPVDITYEKVGANFNGLTSVINIPDSDSLSFGNGTVDTPMTFTAWVKPVQLAQTRILTKGNDTSSDEYRFAIKAADELLFVLYDETISHYIRRVYLMSSEVYANRWIFLCATYDGSGIHTGIKLYVNGILVESTGNLVGTYIAMHNTATIVEIGAAVGASYYTDGIIKDIRMYAEVKSASWINQEYKKCVPDEIILNLYNNKDVSKNEFTITNNGNCGLGINGSLELDGVDDYLSISDNIAFNFAGNAFSIEAWIYADVITTFPILMKGNLQDRSLWFHVSSSVITGGFEQESTGTNIIATGATTLLANQWYYVGFSYDGISALKVYVNGVLDGSLTDATNPAQNTDIMVIGRDASDGSIYANGKISAVKLYGKEVSANEFKLKYDATKHYY